MLCWAVESEQEVFAAGVAAVVPRVFLAVSLTEEGRVLEPTHFECFRYRRMRLCMLTLRGSSVAAVLSLRRNTRSIRPSCTTSLGLGHVQVSRPNARRWRRRSSSARASVVAPVARWGRSYQLTPLILAPLRPLLKVRGGYDKEKADLTCETRIEDRLSLRGCGS